jgi:hypothetical protein
MTSTERCACKHTAYFHFGRACIAYVRAAAGSKGCPCKGFREAPTS